MMRQVVIPNPQGLHARPIALIIQTASRFRSAFRIGLDQQEVNGRSVLELMTLCAGRGTTLTLAAEGEDAAELVDAVAAVIENGFGEM